jgi:hypothetical protein
MTRTNQHQASPATRAGVRHTVRVTGLPAYTEAGRRD